MTYKGGGEKMGNKLDLAKRLLRTKHWVKNMVIFAPMVFAKKAFDSGSVAKVVVAALLFCMLTSCMYILNDIEDITKDVSHPVNRLRPIASGEVSKKNALLVVAVLLPISVMLGICLEINFGIVMIAYFINSYLYSRFLRNMVIIDVMSIAIGFVLRVIGGAEVIGVYVSPWVVICTLFLALFLGFSKRRNEILMLGVDEVKFRGNSEEYTVEFIDSAISVVVSTMLIAYSMYTFFSQNDVYIMTATVPLVIYGIFRYQYLVHRKNGGVSPEETFLSDKTLLVVVAIWILMVMLAIYF